MTRHNATWGHPPRKRRRWSPSDIALFLALLVAGSMVLRVVWVVWVALTTEDIGHDW